MINNLLLQKLEGLNKTFLQKIYVESEFIDPIDVILESSNKTKNAHNSTPFIIIELNKVVAFFTIETSNSNVTGKTKEDGVYWLESFFITKNFLGKGYSKSVIIKMLQELSIHYPTMTSLKLTVNLRNDIAQTVYKKCGFEDTQRKYLGGPAGPQYIYKYEIKC